MGNHDKQLANKPQKDLSNSTKDKKKILRRLTPKQTVYIQAIVDGANKSDAARLAYPDAQYPNNQGYKVMQNESVRQELLSIIERDSHIKKIGEYFSHVLNDHASKSDETSERMSAYDRQHKVSDMIIKIGGGYAPTRTLTADITDSILPQRSKAR